MHLSVISVYVLLFSVQEGECSSRATITRLIQTRTRALKKAKHFANIPPNIDLDEPVHIAVQLKIISINGIFDSLMSYSATVMLVAEWVDDRLNYSTMTGLNKIEIGSRLADDMWTPDIIFKNSIAAERIHDVLFPNLMMIIHPNGKVQFGIRVTVNLKSNMDLRKFPFDSQILQFKLETFPYSATSVYLKWKGQGIIIPEDFNVKRFQFIASSIREQFLIHGLEANYSSITAELELQRSYIYYLVDTYIPSSLIVILSWVSFWLDVEAVPARITLGLLTVLTMTSMSSDISIDLPRLSYIKAIDVWAVTCLLFVCAALMEFAYVNIRVRLDRWFMRLNHSRNTNLDKLDSLLLVIPGSPPSSQKSLSINPSTHSNTLVNHGILLETSMKLTKELSDMPPIDFSLDHRNIDNEQTCRMCEGSVNESRTSTVKSNDEEMKSTKHPEPTTEIDEVEIVIPVVAQTHPTVEIIKTKTNESTVEKGPSSIVSEILEIAESHQVTEHENTLEQVRHIDRVARAIFPLAYGLFNFVYWGSLFISEEHHHDHEH